MKKSHASTIHQMHNPTAEQRQQQQQQVTTYGVHTWIFFRNEKVAAAALMMVLTLSRTECWLKRTAWWVQLNFSASFFFLSFPICMWRWYFCIIWFSKRAHSNCVRPTKSVITHIRSRTKKKHLQTHKRTHFCIYSLSESPHRLRNSTEHATYVNLDLTFYILLLLRTFLSLAPSIFSFSCSHMSLSLSLSVFRYSNTPLWWKYSAGPYQCIHYISVRCVSTRATQRDRARAYHSILL